MLFIKLVVLFGLGTLIESRSSSNAITTVAGTGSSTSSGTGGPALSAGLSQVRSVTMDTAGYVYVVEESAYCIRKFSSSTNIMQTYAGICDSVGSSGDGGAATAATFDLIVSIFMSTVGVAYVGDWGNSKIRRISASNIMTTYGGTGVNTDNGDGGQATSAAISAIDGVWGNSVGVIYECGAASVVRAISTSGIITLFAGMVCVSVNSLV